MKKEEFEKIIDYCTKNGCKFVEIYMEKMRKKNYIYLNKDLDDIKIELTIGTGIRLKLNDKIYYLSSNKTDYESIIKQLEYFFQNNTNLKSSKQEKCELENLVIRKYEPIIEHNKFPIEKKKKFMKSMYDMICALSEHIINVKQIICEYDKEFAIANSNKKFTMSNEITTRYNCLVTAQKENRKESTFRSIGKGQGYEIFENFEKEQFCQNIVEVTLKKLHTKPFKGGKMPVILGNGFGAVIFHEACGHALEATALEDGLSVFANKLGEKIASEKVTLIDDGSLPNEFGTTLIDSEGNNTQKNILIDKGILRKYLVDYINGQNLNLECSSSGRRENYKYPPTSRMNNTYLAQGTDKFEDMLKSIEYGLYCKSLGGGSVNPKTGEFNFTADENYIIRKGKICEMVGSVTLIGKGQEIIQNVEMVSNDLKLESGYCGSKSGTINVTIGQPKIKISNILVGGN